MKQQRAARGSALPPLDENREENYGHVRLDPARLNTK